MTQQSLLTPNAKAYPDLSKKINWKVPTTRPNHPTLKFSTAFHRKNKNALNFAIILLNLSPSRPLGRRAPLGVNKGAAKIHNENPRMENVCRKTGVAWTSIKATRDSTWQWLSCHRISADGWRGVFVNEKFEASQNTLSSSKASDINNRDLSPPRHEWSRIRVHLNEWFGGKHFYVMGVCGYFIRKWKNLYTISMLKIGIVFKNFWCHGNVKKSDVWF